MILRPMLAGMLSLASPAAAQVFAASAPPPECRDGVRFAACVAGRRGPE